MQTRKRYAFQRVRRLKAVASTVHSADTLARPRNRNLRAPCCSLMIPKTSSANCFRSLYIFLASPVSIQARCWSDTASQGPSSKPRPLRRSFVQTPKAVHSRQPYRLPSVTLVPDEVQGLSPGPVITVVVLVVGETVLGVRVLLYRLLFRIRHHHLLASLGVFFQVPTGEITPVGQGRRNPYPGNLLGLFHHRGQTGKVIDFIHHVRGGNQHAGHSLAGGQRGTMAWAL